MSAARCSICSLNWPLLKNEEFKVCPSCGETTSPVANIDPDDAELEESRSRARHLKFERMYAEWDESKPAERLSTEGLKDYAPTAK